VPLLRAVTGRPWLIGAAILTLWALVPIGVALIHVLRHGGVITGTDAVLAGGDQQQYLASIRGSGEHLLIANQFRLGASPAVYLNPMYLISGVLWRLGLDLRLSLLIWTPVAAALLAGGVWAYLRRLLAPGHPGQQAAAAALAIFFFSPVLPALQWTGAQLSAHVRAALLLTSAEAMPGWQLWGYLHTVIVLGLMPLCLLAIERALAADHRRVGRSTRWYLGWASAGGAVIGWLHPWQGLVMLAIMGGLTVWGRFAPRYRLLALPALATLAPMVYLFVLSRANHDWQIFSAQNRAFHDPVWVLLATLCPLVVPALFGVRARIADDDQERILLLWPVACVAVYLAVDQFPFHALQGISIPLAVLAVRGWRRLSLPGLAGAGCIALLTIPGIVFQLDTFHSNLPYAPYWLTNGENAALRYLDRAPGNGGVLSRFYLGSTVPAFTGRSTWVGHYVWTPDFTHRLRTAEQLFDGRIPPFQTQALVRSTGAIYVLTDCESHIDLAPILGELVLSTHRFGCAAVYQVTR